MPSAFYLDDVHCLRVHFDLTTVRPSALFLLLRTCTIAYYSSCTVLLYGCLIPRTLGYQGCDG